MRTNAITHYHYEARPTVPASRSIADITRRDTVAELVFAEWILFSRKARLNKLEVEALRNTLTEVLEDWQ
jgi:hypothetical protein